MAYYTISLANSIYNTGAGIFDLGSGTLTVNAGGYVISTADIGADLGNGGSGSWTINANGAIGTFAPQ
jgi:hypothetical protein